MAAPKSLAQEFDEAPDLSAEFDAAEDLDAPVPVASGPQSPEALGVRTVETPTGPTQWAKDGRQVMSSEDVANHLDSGSARLRQKMLEPVTSFLSGGGPLVDELSGAAAANGRLPSWVVEKLKEKLGGAKAGVSPVDAYRQRRDEVRGTVRDAQEVGPKVAGVPVLPVAGAVVSTAGVGAPATMLGRLGFSAGLGGYQGFAASDADLTKGDVSGSLRDTGVSTLAGLAGGVGGEVLGAVPRYVGGKLQAAGAAAKTARAARDVADVGKEVASLKGQLGSAAQAASRTDENMMRGLQGFSSSLGTTGLDPALERQTLLALTSPERSAVRTSVLEHNLADLPNQNAKLAGLRADLAAKTAGAPQEAAQRTADYFGQSLWDAEVKPRLAPVLGRAAFGGSLAGVGAVSDYLGLTEHGKETMGLSGATVMSAPGMFQMVRNAWRSPLVRAKAGEAAAKILTPTVNAAGTAATSAFSEFARRYGYEPKDEKQMADDHYIKGQRSEP